MIDRDRSPRRSTDAVSFSRSGKHTSLAWGCLGGAALIFGSVACSGEGAIERGPQPKPAGGEPTGWQKHYTIPVKIRKAGGATETVSLAPFPAGVANVEVAGFNQTQTLQSEGDSSTCALQGATFVLAEWEQKVIEPLCGRSLNFEDRRVVAADETATPVPWSSGRQYVWAWPDNCDTNLRRMEFMLCAADTMLAWSEASTMSELRIPYADGTLGDDGTINLPPLPSEWRFIPRDLATYYLSQIPKIDVSPMDDGPTCSVVVGDEWATRTYMAFGRDDLEPPYAESDWGYSRGESQKIAESAINAEDLGFRLAEARTKARIHVLRAGSRLLERAGRLTLESDLGVAERSMDRAGDPKAGAERFWGATVSSGSSVSLPSFETGRGGDVDPYNSMAHTYSYFFGRWERAGEAYGCPRDAPHYSDVLGSTVPTLGARIGAFPPSTDGARRAVTLFEEAGVFFVIPTHSLRDSLRALLLTKRATGATTLDLSMAGITDEDFEQAMRYLTRHAVVSGMSDGGTLPGAVGGVSSITISGGEGTALGPSSGSVAVDGANEVAGELGGPQLASVRDEPENFDGRSVDRIFNIVSQNYGSMALAYARRINEAGQHGATSSVTKLTTESVGEVLAWAGPGWIDTYYGTEEGAEVLTITTHGFGELLGTGENAPVLVKGTVREVECFAGLRSVCPAPESIFKYEANIDYTVDDVNGYQSGMDGPVRTLRYFGSETNFAVGDRGVGNVATKHLYLVQPPIGGSKGRILSSVGVGAPDGRTTQMPVSAAIGKVGTGTLKVADLGKCATSATCLLQKPAGYCLLDRKGDPYPRDIFVPLENELTGDGDQVESSWKHYLARAKEAGAKADELGDAAISAGIQIGLRKEAAQEKLAEYCGVQGLPGDAKFVEHKLVIGDADPVLKSCLDDKTYKRVYFGDCPTATNPTQCACVPGTEGCYTGLKLVGGSTAEVSPPADGCAALATAIRTLHDAPDTPHKVNPNIYSSLAAPGMSPAAIGQRLAGVRFVDRNEPGTGFAWSLQFQGTKIMDSVDPDLWPACRGTCTALDGIYSNIFGVGPSTPLGTIRWRVLGAMSQLVRMSGTSPAGLFTIGVPVQRSDEDDEETSWLNAYPTRSTTDSIDDAITPSPLGMGWSPGFGFTTIPESWLPEVGEDTPYSVSSVRPKPFAYSLQFAASSEHSQGGALTALDGVGLLKAAGETPTAVLTLDELDNLNSADGKIWTPLCGKFGATKVVRTGTPRITTILHDTFIGGGECAAGKTYKTLVPLFGADSEDAAKADHCYWEKLTEAEHEAFNSCIKPAGQEFSTKRDCLQFGTSSLKRTQARLLRPSVCPPSERVRAYANPYGIGDHRGAAARVGSAIGLACRLTPGKLTAVEPGLAPVVTSPAQLPALQAWLEAEANRIEASVGAFYIENLPQGVVDEVKSRSLAQSPERQGLVGRTKIEIGTNLLTLSSRWKEIAKLLRGVAADIDRAMLATGKIDLEKQIVVAEFAVARINTLRRCAQAVVSIASGVSPSDVLGAPVAGRVAAAGIEIASAMAEQAQIGKISDAKEQILAIEVNQALSDMNQNSFEKMSAIQQAMNSLISDAGAVVSGVSSLQQSQNAARYQIALALGEPYYEDESGNRVSVPMNTVLDRQYDVSKRRYEEAAASAKYLAYLARRAVEQRLAVKLEDLHAPVGPLEAPQSWMDDICAMRGLDYERFAKEHPYANQGGTPMPATPSDTSSEDEQEFANAITRDLSKEYIGDYVAKLETFVDQYNVQYPSHEGDDQTVLSIASDVVPGSVACSEDARNLFLYSRNMSESDLSGPDELPLRGWARSACDVGECLFVQDAAALPLSTIPEFGLGDATWLHGQPVEGALPASDGSPPGAVWQELDLSAGSYVLSYWAQSRSASGASAAEPSALQVGMYDAQWKPLWVGPASDVAIDSVNPYAWGPRVVVPLSVGAAGRVRIAFSVGSGSVVVAAPQLERVAQEGGQPTSYQSTASSRTVFSPACSTGSAAAVQAAFRRRCEGALCFYELDSPFNIDTRKLDSGVGLARRFASGNFNYRHISLALNLVGTGVLDCSREASDCYGSSVVEFDLDHSAFGTPLVGWDGKESSFTFGTGSINHGKVISAERFITLPVGPSDQALLSQPGVEKPEFRGRPLDGSYKLRIWERPALVWSRVEDIQIVLKYRYWSAIRAVGTGSR